MGLTTAPSRPPQQQTPPTPTTTPKEDFVKDVTLKNGDHKIIDVKLLTSTEQLKTVVVSAGKFEQNFSQLEWHEEFEKKCIII